MNDTTRLPSIFHKRGGTRRAKRKKKKEKEKRIPDLARHNLGYKGR